MANEPNKQAVIDHSPDKLLEGFSKGRIVFWTAIAVAIHIALIGGTSIGYIRDTWIDPDAAAARKQAAEAALVKKQPVKEAAGPQQGADAASKMPAGQATPATTSAGSEEKLLEERKNAPVVQRITEKAAPNEQPKSPTDIGISIEETNKK